MQHIYMIENKVDSERWVAMGHPSYTLENAKKKLKRVRYRTSRIVRYLPDTFWDVKAYTNED